MGANGSTTDRSAHVGSHTKLGCSWGIGEKQGWRPTMEDAFVATCFGEQGDCAWADTALFGVFDGHGGAEVAKFCADHLPQVVAQGDSSKASVVLRDSFLHVDEMLVDLGRQTPPSDPGHPDNAGCTAVVSLVTPDTIIVANAGDSRAVLCRNGRAVAVSQDHKPHLPKEAARIYKAGGFVTHQRCGPHNVHRVNGKLALSRSMGDLRFKKNTDLRASEQVVSCVPDVKNLTRQSDDEFMVIACDGVWDVMTSQQVVNRIHRDLELIRRGYLQADAVVLEILAECIAEDPSQNFGRGSDNMTMILVVFNKGGGLPVRACQPGALAACLHPSRALKSTLAQPGHCIPTLRTTQAGLPHNPEASRAKRQLPGKLSRESSAETSQGTCGPFAIQSK